MEMVSYLYNKGKFVCGLYGLFAQFTDKEGAKQYTNSNSMRQTIMKNVKSKLTNMKTVQPKEKHPIMGMMKMLQLADTDDKEWEFDELRFYTVDGELIISHPIDDVMNYICKFEIEDLINYEGEIYEVSGVIHDEDRLFIRRYNGGSDEIEIKFMDVERKWSK